MSEQVIDDAEDSCQVLIECRALMLEAKHVRRWQTVGLATGALCVVFVFVAGALSGILIEDLGYVCWVPPVLASVFLAWCILRLRFPQANRGQLQLLANSLVFRFRSPGVKPVYVPLRGLTYLKRQRHWVVVVSDRKKYWFECSRLHVEDLFDALRERLGELGVRVITSESERSGILREPV